MSGMILNSTYRTWALCIAVVLFLIQTPDWAYIPQTLGYLCVFGICLEYLANHSNKNLSFTPVTFFALGYTGICMLSLTWSNVLYHSIAILPLYCLLPVLIVIFKDENKEAKYALFFKVIFVASLILSLISITNVVFLKNIQWGDAHLPFYNSNSLAVFLGVGALISAYNFIFLKQYKYCFGGVLIFLAILATGSAGSVLALLCVLGTMLLLTLTKRVNFLKQTYVIFGVLISFLVFIILIVSFNDVIIETLMKAGSRLPIWQSAIETVLSTNPYIGNGIGTFRDVFKNVYLSVIERGSVTMGLHAHNDVLHLWVEIGLIGLMFVFGIVMVTTFQSIKKIFFQGKQHIALPAAILLYCAMMAMITPVIALPCVLVIIGVSIIQITNQASSSVIIPYGNQILSLLLIVLSCIAIQNGFGGYFMGNVKSAISKGDLIQLVESTDKLDATTMRLHPSAPIFRASSILAMYDQNIIPPHQKEKALNELNSYIQDGRRRNPYNAEVDFYEGEYFLRSGQNDRAKNIFTKILDYDPTYASARIKLFSLINDKNRAYDVLKNGLNYEYWQQNPQQLYGFIYLEAKKRDDHGIAKDVEARLKNLYSPK